MADDEVIGIVCADAESGNEGCRSALFPASISLILLGKHRLVDYAGLENAQSGAEQQQGRPSPFQAPGKLAHEQGGRPIERHEKDQGE
jgi:hypothetical protein